MTATPLRSPAATSSRGWLGGLLLLLLVAAGVLGACRPGPARHPVARVELAGPTVLDNALLGLPRDAIHARFVTALEQSGRFTLPGKGEKRAEGGWRLTLELPFTREAQRTGAPGGVAEVGASLVLERPRGAESQRYEVVGLGEARVLAEGGGQEALRRALEAALTQVAESAALQLAALDKEDAALVRELRAEDPRVQEFALRTLAERRHPAAAPLLIERLKVQDADRVRRAIGALVEMRARAAVPALIELARGKELGFVQEILFALGEIGGEEAEAYLFTVAQGHDQPAVQATAQQALEQLGQTRHLAERTAAPVRERKAADER